MKLYYAANTRAIRIAWLFEELGMDYEIVPFKLGDKSMREPDYLAVNPNGRVPTIVDGDVTIHESGAIVEYVLARYGNGRLIPAQDSPEFAEYLQWLHYISRSFAICHMEILASLLGFQSLQYLKIEHCECEKL